MNPLSYRPNLIKEQENKENLNKNRSLEEIKREDNSSKNIPSLPIKKIEPPKLSGRESTTIPGQTIDQPKKIENNLIDLLGLDDYDPPQNIDKLQNKNEKIEEKKVVDLLIDDQNEENKIPLNENQNNNKNQNPFQFDFNLVSKIQESKKKDEIDNLFD